MSDTEKMLHVFAVLEPHDVLTDEVISGLRLLFGERDISEIGTLKVHQLAAEIVARRDSVSFPSDAKSGEVAKTLLGFMRDMEFIPAQPTEVTPQVVKVVRDKTPAEMDLKELLTALVEDPSRYHDLLPFIEQQDLVVRAARKSPNWTVTGADGKLDVTATLNYLDHLAKVLTVVRHTLDNGRRPTTLARVFNQQERPMRNPFAITMNERYVTGPFWEGYDLSNLPEETHLAYEWAEDTGHPMWPTNLDLFTHVPEAFAEVPTGRWQRIIDDYKAAKAAGELSTEGLSRYAPIDPTASRRPFGGEPERDDTWYRKQLEAVASRAVNQMNSGVRMSHRVTRGIQTQNGGITLDEVISLGPIITMNGRISGRAYVPIGTEVTSYNGKVSQDIYELSWKQLYAKAAGWNIVTP